MTRPAINPAIVRGLRSIASLASAELEMGDESTWTTRNGPDAERALSYLYALCEWHEAQTAERRAVKAAAVARSAEIERLSKESNVSTSLSMLIGAEAAETFESIVKAHREREGRDP